MKSFAIRLFLLSIVSVYFCYGSELPGSEDDKSPEKRKADSMSMDVDGVESPIQKNPKSVCIRNIYEADTPSSSSSQRAQDGPLDLAPGTPVSTYKFAAVESPGSAYSLHSATSSAIKEWNEFMYSPPGRTLDIDSGDFDGSNSKLMVNLDYDDYDGEYKEDAQDPLNLGYDFLKTSAEIKRP